MAEEQMSLLGWTPLMRFDGATFDLDRDGLRLNAQLKRVVAAMMMASGWITLRQLSDATGDPEASCSARLRDCRKARFGLTEHFRVERQYLARGQFCYRLVRL